MFFKQRRGEDGGETLFLENFQPNWFKLCKNGNLFKAIKTQGSFSTILGPNALYWGFLQK